MRGLCVSECACERGYTSLLSSPVETESPYTHKHTHNPTTATTDPAASQSAYSVPQQGQAPPPHTHTLAQMLPYTLALLYSLPPTSHLKRGPEIAQEAIRKNRARGGGGSSRGLKPFKDTLQSLSLPLVIHPPPSLSLPLFVLMNQCFSEHAHYSLIAGACALSLALV